MEKEQRDRLAELLFQEIKKNIIHIDVAVTANNSDMLGIDEFEVFQEIIDKILGKV